MPTPPEQLGTKVETGTDAPNALGALQESVESTPVQDAIQRFIDTVKEGDFDFKGDFDSSSELEQNPVFKRIKDGLEKFFKENSVKTPNAPLQFFAEWMNKSLDFMKGEIAAYNWAYGEMGTDEAVIALEAVEDSNKTALQTEEPGIGPFEKWFESNHPDKYQDWVSEKAQKQETSESFAKKKEELEKRATVLEEKFSKMTSTPEIEKNKLELADLKTKIPDAPDESAVTTYATILNVLEISTAEYEKQFEEKTKQEATAEKLKQEQDAKAAADKKTEEEAALDAKEEGDAPIADKLINFTNRLPADSKLKPILTMIAGFLVSIGVGISKIPWVGGKIRGIFISNKLLAEKGDELAVKALKTERLFRKYGFSRVDANELGEMPTSEAIKIINQKAAQIKPEEITDEAEKESATAEKAKFKNLADVLTQNGGGGNQQSLFDFVASKEWEAPVAPAVAQVPPQTPAPTPAAAPVAAPATPAVAPLGGAPAVATKPVETPETKLIQATNEALKPYNNRTIDLTQETFSFKLPFMSQSGGIEYANCSIKENNVTIGGHKYLLELPMGANLQKITIQGPVQTGSAELVAGKFMMSNSKEIPLKTLLANFDALRKEPKDRTIAMGGDSATFKYKA